MNDANGNYCETMLNQRAQELLTAEHEIDQLQKQVLSLEHANGQASLEAQRIRDDSLVLDSTNTALEKRIQQQINMVRTWERVVLTLPSYHARRMSNTFMFEVECVTFNQIHNFSFSFFFSKQRLENVYEFFI